MHITKYHKIYQVYDGDKDKNIEDSIFTVNGEKFAYVSDASTSLGDDNKDVNYVKVGTAGAVGEDDCMLRLWLL